MSSSNRIALIVGAGVVIFFSLFAWYSREPAMLSSSEQVTMRIGTEEMRVEVVETPEARARGLGGREGLGAREGMLFVFPEDGFHSIWMKDMQFSIDIIWISSSGEIIDIRENVSPDSFPAIFTPSSQARYVVELPAGFAKEHGVRTGDSIEIPVR